MTKRNRGTSGFTLLELIVVVAIIGIAMAIAVPNILSWLPNYRLRAATGDLLSNLQRARIEAIKRNTPCTLSFNVNIDGTTFDYAVFIDNNGDGNYDAGDIPLVRARWADYPGVILDAVNNGGVIRFNRRGQPAAGGITVDLSNAQGNRKSILVNIVGNARILQL